MIRTLLLVLAFSLLSAQEPLVTLAGSVTVVDWSSNRSVPEEGVLVLAVEALTPEANRHFSERVAVRGGRFRVELPPNARFRVERVWLDGVAADVEGQPPGKPYQVTSALQLEVRPMYATVLKVVDAGTQADVSGELRVVELSPARQAWIHPGAERGTRRASSELALVPSSLEHTRFVVGAKGYAWHPVDVDSTTGGEGRLFLERAGAIDLETVPRFTPNVRLRVRRAGEPRGQVLFELERVQGGRPIEGLAPGAYTLSAERGEPGHGLLVYGAVDALVVAGERTAVTLPVAGEGRTRLARGHGTLTVAREWGLEPFDVELRLNSRLIGANTRSRVLIPWSELQPVPEAPGVYGFEAGELQVGCYQLIAGKLDGLHFDVTPAGEASHVRVPPPASALVEFIDDLTGQAVRVEHARWSKRGPGFSAVPEGHPDGFRGGYSVAHTMEFDEEHGAYRLRAPRGPVLFSVRDRRFAFPVFVPRELDGGGERLTVRLERVMGVLVRLSGGDTPLGIRDRPTLRLVPLDPDGHPSSGMLYADGGFRAVAAKPGRYRLEVDPPAGYRTVPSREVVVEADEVQVVEIRLAPGG